MSQLTQHITTGPHPAGGGCIAQYNHATFNSHTPLHSSNHNYNHNHINPYIQQPITGFNPYGVPPWRPPGTSIPFMY